MSGEADLVPYFTRYRGRLAKTKQIREVLTNIRMMRLVVSTKPKIDSVRKIISTDGRRLSFTH